MEFLNRSVNFLILKCQACPFPMLYVSRHAVESLLSSVPYKVKRGYSNSGVKPVLEDRSGFIQSTKLKSAVHIAGLSAFVEPIDQLCSKSPHIQNSHTLLVHVL